jgi:tRNA-splicing endonuclease subunit Sen34
MASSAQAAATVAEPFPIFTVAHKYILYDVDTVSHARAKHNITGVLIGGLPQAPQQNVFSGIPLELMPEEARLLVEKGVAYLVDDVKAHKDNMLGNGLAPEERRAFQSALRKQGSAAAKDAERKMEERKKGALEKKFGSSDWNDIPEDMLMSNGKRGGKKGKRAGSRTPVAHSAAASGAATPAEEVESLFAPPTASAPPSGPPKASPSVPPASSGEPTPWAVTPTTSASLLNPIPPPPQEALPLPDVPTSYPLFKHLHEKSYFMSPGLRFGCQYTAYPGDPLRFHSHFLCSGMDWEEEFDLLDIVGGGRLGTGVKKGYLIGGQEPNDGEEEKDVRTFCIEWGGM